MREIGGRKPDDGCLEKLTQLASKYAEKPTSVVRLGSQEVLHPCGSRVAEGEPYLCSEFPFHDQASYVLIDYTGWGFGELGGFSKAQVMTRKGVLTVSHILIFQNSIDDIRALWMSRRRGEYYCLLHEYGHAMGLVVGDAHRVDSKSSRGDDSNHCKNAGCPMAVLNTKTCVALVWRGVTFRGVDDYCKDCRADVALVKSAWDRDDGG